MTDAQRKVGAVVATALSVTIIVGAGLLVLPGVSYAHAGRYGYVPWLLVMLLMLPLLQIFAYFGKTSPSAGGIVGYVHSGLGWRVAAICEVIVLGTFTLGIPAIALIGAGYLQQIIFPVSLAQRALCITTLAFMAGLIGLRISGAIQTVMAMVIVAGLIIIGAGFLFSNHPMPLASGVRQLPDVSWNGVIRAVPAILFAFTGWEMTAFLAEDMKNPEKDLPKSIWASFVIVSALYIFIAWIVAVNATPDDQWEFAPVVQLAKGWLGESGGKWVGLVAALLVVANVVAAFLSASRAVFSAGRNGLLPRFIGKLDDRQVPVRAMVLIYMVFMAVIFMAGAGIVRIDTLLQLAGQNFFILYLMTAIAYTVIQRRHFHRWIGYMAVAVVLGMMLLFSIEGLVYCGALVVARFWLGRPGGHLNSNRST